MSYASEQEKLFKNINLLCSHLVDESVLTFNQLLDIHNSLQAEYPLHKSPLPAFNTEQKEEQEWNAQDKDMLYMHLLDQILIFYKNYEPVYPAIKEINFPPNFSHQVKQFLDMAPEAIKQCTLKIDHDRARMDFAFNLEKSFNDIISTFEPEATTPGVNDLFICWPALNRDERKLAIITLADTILECAGKLMDVTLERGDIIFEELQSYIGGSADPHTYDVRINESRLKKNPPLPAIHSIIHEIFHIINFNKLALPIKDFKHQNNIELGMRALQILHNKNYKDYIYDQSPAECHREEIIASHPLYLQINDIFDKLSSTPLKDTEGRKNIFNMVSNYFDNPEIAKRMEAFCFYNNDAAVNEVYGLAMAPELAGA